MAADRISQPYKALQSVETMQSDTLFQKRGRDRLSIVALILEAAIEEIPKTQIMQRASLSVPQLYEYLPFLLKRGLLSQSETKTRALFRTTRKGLKFLQNYREINSLLDGATTEELFENQPVVIAVIPAFNEENFIASLVLQARKYAERVIVCDDGSSDLTAEIAERVGAHVLRHETNKGYGATLATLFMYAKETDADIIVTMDADGQHDPSEISNLIKPILQGDADITIGSRLIVTDKTQYVPLYTKVGFKAISKMLAAMTGKKISDTQSGFRAYNRKALNEIKISGEKKGANLEILMDSIKNGFRIVEVPTECQRH